MQPLKPPERKKLAYSFETQKLSTDSNLVTANRPKLENQVITGRFSDVSNPRPDPIKCISNTSSEKNFENVFYTVVNDKNNQDFGKGFATMR